VRREAIPKIKKFRRGEKLAEKRNRPVKRTRCILGRMWRIKTGKKREKGVGGYSEKKPETQNIAITQVSGQKREYGELEKNEKRSTSPKKETVNQARPAQ